MDALVEAWHDREDQIWNRAQDNKEAIRAEACRLGSHDFSCSCGSEHVNRECRWCHAGWDWDTMQGTPSTVNLAPEYEAVALRPTIIEMMIPEAIQELKWEAEIY